jgi:phage tail-like protein
LLADEWKYVPMRRLALFIEESLYRGTQWVVFEPNDEPLWAQIRLNVGAFMQDLFRQGAFQGSTPARCLSRQVRQGDDDPVRHRPRHRQHRRRLRAAQAGRVRHHAHPADDRAGQRLHARRVSEDYLACRSFMAKFSVNAQRFDPYKNFKFRVKWDGRYVAGVSKVGALKRTTDPSSIARAATPAPCANRPARRSTTRSRSNAASPTTLEFEQWANKVWNFGSGLGAEVSLKDFRKDVIIEVYNEAGQLAIAYKVYRCWVSASTQPKAARTRRQRQRRRHPVL